MKSHEAMEHFYDEQIQYLVHTLTVENSVRQITSTPRTDDFWKMIKTFIIMILTNCNYIEYIFFVGQSIPFPSSLELCVLNYPSAMSNASSHNTHLYRSLYRNYSDWFRLSGELELELELYIVNNRVTINIHECHSII